MKAILPILDENREEPYYMQLYRYLREAIAHDEIGEDERLPSLRSLAKSTGLSITTVEKAYDQLLVEGYIYSKPQSGFYAEKVKSNQFDSYAEKGPLNQSDSHAEKGPASLFNAHAEKPSQHQVPALSGGGSSVNGQTVPYENSIFGEKLSSPLLYDPDCFDFNKWKKCMNRVLNEYSQTLFFEGSPQGEAPLRVQIARYLYQSRGVSCQPEQIVIAAGTQQITNLLATILRRLQVEHVALEDPGYAPVRNTFRDRGFAINSVEVAGDGLALEKLPVNIQAAVYVSPSNHSFTGAVMPIGRRYELIRWAVANDSYIIEDDYDSELRYFGRPIPALKSLTGDDRVIYLGSFSSTLFAAVKISYMVLPPQIAEDFSRQLSGYSQTCSKLEQLTLAMFMETGWYQTHIRKLRKLYAQKLALVTEVFRREAADFIRVRNTASGITVLLEIAGTGPSRPQSAGQGDTNQIAADCERIAADCKRSGPDARKAPFPKTPDQLKQDALRMGIPIGLSKSLLLLYYNQIPLDEIEERLTGLIRLWRD